MFSSRLDWTSAPNRISELLARKRAAGARLLDLTESNPTQAGIHYPSAQILDALYDSRSMRYEPAAAGIEAARTAVAGYYSGRVSVDRILLTASTSEAYSFLFKLLADPGDEVLVPRPSYPLFEFLASLESVRVVQYPLHYDGTWAIDFDALACLITPRTRAVVLVNPNNPTGSFLKQRELDQLTSLCTKHDLAIISDEVFADYALTSDPLRVSSLHGVEQALTFSLSGLSKAVGLPQMKLGWMVVSGPAEAGRQAWDRLELIADTYLSVSAPVQWAAARLLESRHAIQEQILNRVRGNLATLRSRVGADSPWRVLEVEGGWYAILQAPRVRSEEEWVLTLVERDEVIVQPGYFFDFDREAFLVVSLLTKPDIFDAGLARILIRT